MEKVNGWNNWETKIFAEWELDTLTIHLDGSEEKEDIVTLVETHYSILAESLEVQALEGVASDFIKEAFHAVDIEEIIEAVWEHVQELQE